MTEALTILIAARDEAGRVGGMVKALRRAFPNAGIVVADDGSTDATADEAEAAGAIVLRLRRRGKGQALSVAERAAPPGRILLCDADLAGDLAPLVENGADLAIAAFAERQGGGFGIAKRLARAVVRALGGFEAREPLSGQRAYSPAARAAAFPLAAGFGCEVRGTIDVARAGLQIEEVVLPLRHRATGRDVRGFAHRGRQLLDLLLGAGPLAVNHRGLRLPLVGWTLALGPRRAISAVALVGLADDLFSGPERGFRAHLRSGATTGVASNHFRNPQDACGTNIRTPSKTRWPRAKAAAASPVHSGPVSSGTETASDPTVVRLTPHPRRLSTASPSRRRSVRCINM